MTTRAALKSSMKQVYLLQVDFDNQQDIPCTLEIDLEYLNKLKVLHKEYPLPAEKLMINKVETLVPNLNEKEMRCFSQNTQVVLKPWFEYQNDS